MHPIATLLFSAATAAAVLAGLVRMADPASHTTEDRHAPLARSSHVGRTVVTAVPRPQPDIVYLYDDDGRLLATDGDAPAGVFTV